MSARSRIARWLAAFTIVAACTGDDDTAQTTTTIPEVDVSVMTRNLYLGADLIPLFETTADDLAAVARVTWEQVEASEVDARLAAVADEIERSGPDIVALQEASLWTTQPEGATEPTVLHDFLQTLLDELDARGQHYTVAVSGNGFSGGLPVEGIGFISLQDRDVILVQDDRVTVTGTRSGIFAATLSLDVASIPIEVARGWAAVDLTVEDRPFTVVVTHLEAFDDPARDAQQVELLEVAGTTGPVVVVGDLNSAAGDAGPDGAAYDAMIAAGFVDAWSEIAGDDTGFTCCFDADLLAGDLDERIDFVLLNGGLGVEGVSVVGTDEGGQTSGGRWPSDHAGVVADLTVPE